ncbi:MAG: hybrid sensor histidine kinase/response regulator [Spirochaetia bacterium]|nr:hybrid sensor histidine kinase/response regulator [Spirochaetia bacterium]
MPETIKDMPVSVLIVDDTPENIQVLGSLLESKNYKIYAAQNGVQALKIADEKIHDIILLDVMMPELNGFETCKKLKESEKTKNIPVIFLTAKVETEDIVKGFEVGGVDYVTKPFNSSELLKRIETHTTLRRTTERLKQSNTSFKELVHILCHDLGNPIYAVQGILELGSEDKDFMLDNIDTMQTAIKNAGNIIEVIKTLRALEESKLKFETEVFQLKPLIEESAKIIDSKIKEKNIKMDIDVPIDVKVKVEKTTFINSVINNLLTNAIKFSEKGSSINISSQSVNDNTQLTIRDFGMGMPKSIKENLFKLNSVTTRTGTENEQGTGFGMPLVKKFINSYGGEIEINSWEKGDTSGEVGTEVKITLKSS